MSGLQKHDGSPDAIAPGLDLLRSLAGYPQRSVHLGKHRVQSRVVWIERDSEGNVLGSIERQELSEYTDLEGQFLD